MLRSNTIKIGNVLAGFQKPRDTLVLRAVMLRDESGVLDAAAITDLGGVRITLEQKGLWSGAGRSQDDGREDKQYSPSSHPAEATLPETNGKR
jgi:hypothetical protein